MREVEVTEAVLTEGGSANVSVPGNAPLTFAETFENRERQTMKLIADFTRVGRGQTDEYVLQPVGEEN